MTNCVILIGMPGAGKSTLGVQFALQTDLHSVDAFFQVEEGGKAMQ